MSDTQADLASAAREAAAQAHLRHHDDAPCTIPACLIASYKEGWDGHASWAQSAANPNALADVVAAGDKNEANVRKVDTVDTDEAAEAFHRRASKYASGFRYAGGEVDLALQSAVAQAYIEGYCRESALRAQSAAPAPLSPPTDKEVDKACVVYAKLRCSTRLHNAMRAALTAFMASRGKGNQK